MAGGGTDAEVGADRPPSAGPHEPDGDLRVTGPQLADLDERIRRRVVSLAAAALSDIAASDVPVRLRPFVRFAARRRADLAGPTVAAVLEADALFRQRVADTLGDVARVGDQASAVDTAAAAWLTRPPNWPDLVAVIATAEPARSPGTLPTTRLTEQLAAARSAARRDRAAARADADALRAELATARAEVQRTTRAAVTADARAEATLADRDATVARAAAEAAVSASTERRLRARIADLERVVGDGRRQGRRSRAVEDTRLRLLVDTLVGAAHGLAAELALPAGAQALPAETVDAREPGSPGADTVVRWDDPDLLPRVLRLPGAHLIVDGYNVTKAAVPNLTLEQQRFQLLRVLAVMAGQTGAEITAVFDGSDVTAVPAAAARGVRVRFSPAGVTADAVIRAMARAEPEGRPVVVVSSDREVAAGVLRAGARSAPSSVLTERLLTGRTA